LTPVKSSLKSLRRSRSPQVKSSNVSQSASILRARVTRDPDHLVQPAIAAFSVAILPTVLLGDLVQTVNVHTQDVTHPTVLLGDHVLTANAPTQDVTLPTDQLVDLVLTASVHTQDVTHPTDQLVDLVQTASVHTQDVTHPTVLLGDLVQTASVHTQDVIPPTVLLGDQDQTQSVHTQDGIVQIVPAMERAAIKSARSHLGVSLVRDTSARVMVPTDPPGERSAHLGTILRLGLLMTRLRVVTAILVRPHRIGSL
jgi:hypothetical protein